METPNSVKLLLLFKFLKEVAIVMGTCVITGSIMNGICLYAAVQLVEGYLLMANREFFDDYFKNR